MKQKRFTKPEWAWMLYDVTTNAYATIILTAIFPIYFNAVLGENSLGLQMKGYAQSGIMLIAALSCPILGAIGDVKGMKKRLWAGFAFSGAFLTLCLAFTSSWQWLLVGYILSNIAYNSANLFYDSFLTDVAEHDRMHKVSTTAFAVGYFGGGTMMLIVTAALLFTMGSSNPLAVKISFAVTAAWWILFSVPMAKRVRQVHYNPRPLRVVTHTLFRQLGHTIQAIAADKGMRWFVLAYFFYIDGVGTVITMATSYGSTLGLNSTLMIVAILTTQLVAVPCSILFGRLATKVGAIRMITVAIGIYFVICIVGFYMGYAIDTAAPGAAREAAIARGQILFWIVAGMVGTAQGGIQALSRSQFGRMVPPDRSNEYFGFFNIFNRFASILGPALMAFMTGITGGRSEYGILSIIILFAIGGWMLIHGRGHIHTTERNSAEPPAGEVPAREFPAGEFPVDSSYR